MYKRKEKKKREARRKRWINFSFSKISIFFFTFNPQLNKLLHKQIARMRYQVRKRRRWFWSSRPRRFSLSTASFHSHFSLIQVSNFASFLYILLFHRGNYGAFGILQTRERPIFKQKVDLGSGTKMSLNFYNP